MNPGEYAKWEWNEDRLRAKLGNVAILTDRKGGDRKPLTLHDLRERMKGNLTLDFGGAEEEWGGCNCFTPLEEGAA